MNGELSYLKLDNSSNGFPNDPGLPVSGTLGVDYKWANGWLVGAALTLGLRQPDFLARRRLHAGFGFGELLHGDTGTTSVGRPDRHRRLGSHDTTNRHGPDRDHRANEQRIDQRPAIYRLPARLATTSTPGSMTHGPVAGFILQQAKINGFTESGSFTSLSFATQTRNSEVSTLGYQGRLRLGNSAPVRPGGVGSRVPSSHRVVTASLTTTAAPSFSLPAVVLGRDWATTTVGTHVTFDRSWSGITSFTAQLGQNHALVYGGLVGLDYSFGQDLPAPVFVPK